jgi:flagellar assembly factor FliW
MASKKQDYETAITYETERVGAYQKTMNAFQETVQLSLQEIKEYKLRVEQMREVTSLPPPYLLSPHDHSLCLSL